MTTATITSAFLPADELLDVLSRRDGQTVVCRRFTLEGWPEISIFIPSSPPAPIAQSGQTLPVSYFDVPGAKVVFLP